MTGAPAYAGVFSAWCDLREIMVLNTVMGHLVGMVGTQIFWGTNPRAPIGG